MANELPAISQQIKDLVSSMKGHVQKLGSTIGGHMSDIMSDEMKMVNDTVKQGFTFTKDATLKTLAFFGKSFGMEWKNLKVQISQLKMLKLITGQMERTEKSRLARFKGRSKDFLVALLELLGLSLVAVGAAAGAILGKFLLPFTLLAKTLKKLLPISKALKALAKTGPIARLIKSFGWLGRIFTFFGKLWGIRHILRGLKFGFAKLVWPLQIIMSAIDFVKGFMATEGTILDKIKGGLKNVVMKFIEWPVEMLTKIINKIMKDALGDENWKNLDSTEIMKKIGKAINDFFTDMDKTFKDMYNNLVDLIRIINDPSWDNLKTVWKRRQDKAEEERKQLEIDNKAEAERQRKKEMVTSIMPFGQKWVSGKIFDFLNKPVSVEERKKILAEREKKASDQRERTAKATEKMEKMLQDTLNARQIILNNSNNSGPQTIIPDKVGDIGLDGAMGEMVRGRITPR